MTEVCEFCGDGETHERGEPMYYEGRDVYAHIDCAIDHGIGQDD